MPLSPVHKEKFRKNVSVFIIVLGFMALIWAITIFKIREYGVTP